MPCLCSAVQCITNNAKFGGLKDKLENESLFGHDNYPKDQAELLHIMNKYTSEVTQTQRIRQKNTDDAAFIQADKPDDNKDSVGGTGDTETNFALLWESPLEIQKPKIVSRRKEGAGENSWC